MALLGSNFPSVQNPWSFPFAFLLLLLRIRGIDWFLDRLRFDHGLEEARIVGRRREPETGVGPVKDPNGIQEEDIGSVEVVDTGVDKGGELVSLHFSPFI